jgi:uncharacterized GH25 family protein
MKKYVTGVLIFCCFMIDVSVAHKFFAEATEKKTPSGRVPLKLYFAHGYDASGSEGVLSGDGAIYFITTCLAITEPNV